MGDRIQSGLLLAGLSAYAPTVLAMGAVAGLLLVQIVVVDITAIRAHHKPGAPVEPDHRNFLFRAVRAHANTNESLAAFILLALFGMFSAAAPAWLNALSWIYVAARLGHMLCYYADLRLSRSISFGIGLVALIGLLIAGTWPWLR